MEVVGLAGYQVFFRNLCNGAISVFVTTCILQKQISFCITKFGLISNNYHKYIVLVKTCNVFVFLSFLKLFNIMQNRRDVNSFEEVVKNIIIITPKNALIITNYIKTFCYVDLSQKHFSCIMQNINIFSELIWRRQLGRITKYVRPLVWFIKLGTIQFLLLPAFSKNRFRFA